MNNLKVKLFAVFSLLLLSLSVSSVVAQSPYDGAVTTGVALSSDGTCTVCDNFGVTYEIQGTPSSTGTVTTQIPTANPQPTANTPNGITLTHFVIVTFNVNAADFTQAKITIPYTDSDVRGVQTPYSIFKYVPATDSYTELPAIVDENAKTFTVTVTSVDDPLFAIGGASSVSGNNGGFSTIAWAALAASVVIIVMLAVVGVWYFKKASS
jgi:hypothetical protein